MDIHNLDTPCLVVNLDVMMRNIGRLQEHLDGYGIANRPHIKTHKVPTIAHLQVDAGASGITCQKLGEAEIMADAGIRDILITYNIVGRQKLERLAGLATRIDLTVTVDSLDVAQGISAAAAASGSTVGVLVELATELERTGVPAPADLVELAGNVARLPGLCLRGMMLYPSSPQNAGRVAEAVAGLRAAGLSTEIVSGGGTPEALRVQGMPHVTEHRAGTYVFNDRATVDKGAATWDDCALSVLVTVVSRPAPDRAIIDGGSKTFSSDYGVPMGHVVGWPGAHVYKMNEEHGYVDVSGCAPKPAVGDRMQVIPNHVCGTVNMHDVIYGVRDDRVEVVWTIEARGKLR
jgi:D-serine deaminase-like pyridoxal phosphate-dependent protein